MKVGVLGAGQLGQMMMAAAQPLMIDVICFDPAPNPPAARLGPVVTAPVSDRDALDAWAESVDVITYEFENFPAELVAHLAEMRPVVPPINALAAAQDRWAEKRTFNEIGIPVSPFRMVTSEQELQSAITELDFPVVAKTRTGGYDGKGQAVLRGPDDIASALALLDHRELIVEQFVPFTREISVVGCRSHNGEITTYAVVENEHRQGILHASRVPARVTDDVGHRAVAHMETLLRHLQYVGVLALEMFEMDGRLFANEMAPRVHNSGHWTIEGASTSQFENHLRAVTGLPLGSTELLVPTAMVNIVGILPDLREVLAIPGTHLHLYGKSARPGRKLGHITITAANTDELATRLDRVEKAVHNVLS